MGKRKLVGALTDEELTAISNKQRGIPQAHEIAKLIDHIDQQAREIARLRGALGSLVNTVAGWDPDDLREIGGIANVEVLQHHMDRARAALDTIKGG